MGARRYPSAQKLASQPTPAAGTVIARAWKAELPRLADKIKISIEVSHFPPGTSK